MSLLARLETDLRDAVSRAFTESRVSLVDLGRALVAEDRAAGSTGGPRVLDVDLSPGDLDALETSTDGLSPRLARLVADQRAERSGDRGGSVAVRLRPDRGLSPGVFRVQASVEGTPRGSGGSAVEGTPAVGSSVIARREEGGAPSPALPGRPRLVVVLGGTVVSGTEYADGEMVELELDERVAVIGSAPDANLLLPAGTVAPHHVEVRFREDGYHEAVSIHDSPLRINGQPGSRGLLTDGARLDLGDLAIVYRRDMVGREAEGAAREGTTRTDGA